MNNNSVKITLYRKGGSEKPEYIIIIYDDGTVVYEGLNNVKIKSKIQTSISEDEIIFILEELRSSKLFSINQKYSIDEGLNRSFTKISVEIPGVQDQIKTKTIIHYDDDPLIPNSLKIFENKIDEVVKSYRWVKVSSEEKKQAAPVQKPSIKKPVQDVPIKKKNNKKKIFKIAVPAGLAVVVALCLVFLNMNNFFVTEADEPVTEYDPPNILSLSSAKSISSGDIPINSSMFAVNDNIYIYFNYANITHNDTYDFSAVVSIYHGSNLVDSCDFEITTDEKLKSYCVFRSNSSWPLGEYRVVFKLEDKISALSASSDISFTLYEKIPKVIIFRPASSVTTYRNYAVNYNFQVGDDVFLYVEYTGINTTSDNTECDIFIKVNITDSSNNVYGFHSQDKNTVGNNAHFWKFSTNSSWTANFYIADFYLYDYSTGLGATKSTFFIVRS